MKKQVLLIAMLAMIFTLLVSLPALAATEPQEVANGSIESAYPIGTDRSVDGITTSKYDDDFYSFTTDKDVVVRLRIELAGESRATLGISPQRYSSGGTDYSPPWSETYMFSGDLSPRIHLGAGTHYFAVFSNRNDIGDYTVYIEEEPASSLGIRKTESNSSFANAQDMELATDYVANMINRYESDYYKFTMAQAGSIEVDVNTYGELHEDISWTIYDSTEEDIAFTRIHFDEFDNGAEYTSDAINLAAGTYYLLFSNIFTNEDYVFSINPVGSSTPTVEETPPTTEQTPDNLYTDSQGNSLLLPYGERSFASKVISFTPGTSAPTGDSRWNNPQMALGEPQGGDMNDDSPRLVTLGYDGVLVVAFDVWFNDGPGEDIWVFELGADIEPTKVEVSQDGINWIFVGNSEGATSFVDMDGYVDKDMYFNYIRLTDIEGVDSGAPGADIDAVAVINNATANPNPELVLAPEIEQTPIDGEFNAEAMPFGANFSWQEMDDVLGYRIYRSEVEGEEGISITDFYIEDTNRFVDVNVDGGKTYWYSIRGVIAEADPFNDKTEVLTAASAQIKVVMPASLSGGNASGNYQPKQFILMQISNPMMSINGRNLEVDPGQGTSPIIKDSRTLVPIRAIVEGMGGNVGWDEAARQVDLLYADNEVSMWLGSKQLIVNNSNLTMDVPPDILNGRTMLPIRFAAENLGCTVEWINSSREIVIIFR